MLPFCLFNLSNNIIYFVMPLMYSFIQFEVSAITNQNLNYKKSYYSIKLFNTNTSNQLINTFINC